MGLFKSTRKRLSVIDYFIKRGTVTKKDGLTVPKLAVATYDVSGGDDGAIGAHGLGVHIPDNAIITRAWIDVITTFTDGADDSATMAVHIQSADDLVAAIAMSSGTIWDAGIKGTLAGSPILGIDAAHDTAIEVAALIAASMIKTTAEREITVTVADDDPTAGKMVIYVEYVLSD